MDGTRDNGGYDRIGRTADKFGASTKCPSAVIYILISMTYVFAVLFSLARQFLAFFRVIHMAFTRKQLGSGTTLIKLLTFTKALAFADFKSDTR